MAQEQVTISRRTAEIALASLCTLVEISNAVNINPSPEAGFQVLRAVTDLANSVGAELDENTRQLITLMEMLDELRNLSSTDGEEEGEEEEQDNLFFLRDFQAAGTNS